MHIPDENLTSEYTSLRGVRVFHRRRTGNSTGPAVVLVHGIGVSGTYMVPAAKELIRAGYKVFVPDLPGFGKSNKPRKISKVDDLADDLAAYMDLMQLDRAALIGNSYGCQIIVEFCQRYPHRSSCIVLLGPTVDAAARTFHQQMWRLLVDSTREPLSQVLIVAADYLRFGLFHYLRTFRHALADHVEIKLSTIAVPCLVIRGSRDAITSQEWAEELAATAPQGEIATVANGPHTANYACPKQFVEAIAAFLEQHTSPTQLQ